VLSVDKLDRSGVDDLRDGEDDDDDDEEMMMRQCESDMCGSEVRRGHVRSKVLVSEPNGRSRLTPLRPGIGLCITRVARAQRLGGRVTKE
jgi:hypothetical protein